MEQIGPLHRHSDVLTKLNNAQIDEVGQNEQLVAYKAERNALSQKFRSISKRHYSDDAIAVNQNHKRL